MGAPTEKLSRFSLRSLAGPLLALLLTSCVAAVGPGQDGPIDRHELFSEGYERISHYYIESTTAERLGLAGLGRLSMLDPAISVERRGDAVVLMKDAAVIGRYEAPPAADNWGWGGVTAAALETARQASPKLASASEDQLDKAVFDGAVGTLDRFSRYSTPETARDQRAERNGFDGIGVTLDAEETEVRIVSVLPGGPAEQAGIKANDKIVGIDGTPTSTLTREQVVQRLRGPAGSRVTIAIMRDSATEPRNVAVSRAHIVLPTVTVQREGRIAIFRISSFNQETADQLVEAFGKAEHEIGGPPAGIVLDLRDNPGGLLDQSISVANVFLSEGLVVSTAGRLPESRKQFFAEPSHLTDGIPMTVLVNGGSASASEIVAAALQDRGRAVVIGTSSFGKGTVQTVLELVNDGELTVTWAKLLSPEGYTIHEHGVVPTLCTADLGEDQASFSHAMEVGTTLGTGLAASPRSALDEQGWKTLRDSCPAQRVDRVADLKLAEQLLRDPALYARALNVTPTRFSHTAAVPTTR
ncbi:MAG TPA: S41 family peptidase [Stellaceae bacterium]|nr:S41 family peptidase [Stellaceae bacterium]